MNYLICPICGEEMELSSREAFCKSNHHFDRAKQGYINLLLTQQSSEKRHGDDSMMIKARGDFLSKGYYSKLADTVSEVIADFTAEDCAILDIGCGEGYYTEAVYKKLDGQQKICEMICLDISKEATKAISKRLFPKTAIVASASKLPVAKESIDVIMSIFSVVNANEFSKVLKPGGLLLRVVPKEYHLFELKKEIYDEAYENSPVEQKLEGYEPLKAISLDYEIELSDNTDIDTLFRMTPYYYKTSRSDQEKQKNIKFLKTRVSFGIFLDRKV